MHEARQSGSSAARLAKAFTALAFFACALVLAVAVRKTLKEPSDPFNAFYALAAAGLAGCAVFARLPVLLRLKLALSSAILVAGLLACEVAIFYRPRPALITSEHIRRAREAGIEFDERSQLDAVRDMRAKGVDAWPCVYPSEIRRRSIEIPDGAGMLVPLGGISRKLTVLDRERGYYTTYMSDEHGFRNPTGLYQRAAVDLVMLGDSFGQGHGADDGQNIAGWLRSAGWRVLNLSMGSNGQLVELATLKEYAARVEPPVVLWLYYEENDISNTKMEAQSPAYRAYLSASSGRGLAEKQEAVDRVLMDVADRALAEKNVGRLADSSRRRLTPARLGRMLKLYHIREALGLVPEPPAKLELFEEILRNGVAAAAAWNARVVFVYLPSGNRYAGTVPDHGKLYERKRVLDTVRKIGLPVVDVHEAFARHADPLSLFPFRLAGHYAPEGYRVAARAIDEQLAQDLGRPPAVR